MQAVELHQNPPALNCGCWITQVGLYNGIKWW